MPIPPSLPVHDIVSLSHRFVPAHGGSSLTLRPTDGVDGRVGRAVTYRAVSGRRKGANMEFSTL